jgi:hypothetical protein
MNHEEQFVRKLEAFLNEDFNDYSRKRIISYLKDYADSIPPVIIKKERINNEIEKVLVDCPNCKEYATIEKLKEDAIEFCLLNNVDFNSFTKSKMIKTNCKIAELRKEFTVKSFEKYFCSNKILANFFNVHYSTISFYLYGKNTRIKKIERI